MNKSTGKRTRNRGSDSNGAKSHAKRRFPDSLGVGGIDTTTASGKLVMSRLTYGTEISSSR